MLRGLVRGSGSRLSQSWSPVSHHEWVWADIFIFCNPPYLFGCFTQGNSQKHSSALIFHPVSEPLWIPRCLALHRKPSVGLFDRHCIYDLLQEASLHIRIRNQQANSALFLWKWEICEPVNRILTDQALLCLSCFCGEFSPSFWPSVKIFLFRKTQKQLSPTLSREQKCLELCLHLSGNSDVSLI